MVVNRAKIESSIKVYAFFYYTRIIALDKNVQQQYDKHDACVFCIGKHYNRRQKRQFSTFRFKFGPDCHTGERGHGLADIHGARHRPGFGG